MAILNKMLNFVGWETEDEEYLEDEFLTDEIEDTAKFKTISTKKPSDSNKVVSITKDNPFKVVILKPENFEDAQEICDHVKDRKPVIFNLEELEKESAQRIVDFLSGSIYALGGNIEKVSSNIFLIAPVNVDIMSAFGAELKDKTVFPWLRQS
jgi:cell division inhibitor SepF